MYQTVGERLIRQGNCEDCNAERYSSNSPHFWTAPSGFVESENVECCSNSRWCAYSDKLTSLARMSVACYVILFLFLRWITILCLNFCVAAVARTLKQLDVIPTLLKLLGPDGQFSEFYLHSTFNGLYALYVCMFDLKTNSSRGQSSHRGNWILVIFVSRYVTWA